MFDAECKQLHMQQINGITYKLKAPFDFGFLEKYGTVFQVYDDQDSGNICFGTEKDGERLFIKFAGAPTAEYNGDPRDAIARLKQTVRLYEQLRHDSLIQYIGAEEIGGGFSLIFKWTDAKCMGRMYPEARKKFLELPLSEKVKVFRDILGFLEYVASQNYAAIDFYDGSIMYDFDSAKTVICDIDFFQKRPCVNHMGRLWGSSLFQSPEEYRLGAQIDEVTNVYTAGATAFALFSDFDRTGEKWPLGDALYRVAARAVSEDRELRQQSIRQFIDEWETNWRNSRRKCYVDQRLSGREGNPEAGGSEVPEVR